MDDMIDEKAVEALMKSMGYERISDYIDMNGCNSYSGTIWQFFNPKTKKAVQFCIGEYDDQLTLSEHHIIECQEKWDVKTGEKIFQEKIAYTHGDNKGEVDCPNCDWNNKPTIDPETGECCICNRFFKIEVLPAN